MDAIRARSVVAVAVIQAAVALSALFCSPSAALVAFSVGLLAIGRYVSVAFFAASMKPKSAPLARALAASAWGLGFVALLVLVAAVAAKAKADLPWAVAAAFAGPLGLTLYAAGSGLGLLASDRARIEIKSAGGDR